MTVHNDEYWMAEAIKLARNGARTTTPNPNVGCVIVKDGNIVGRGFHRKAGTPHAEVHALHEAGGSAEDATAYVTLEPCSHFGKTPPCADALIHAKVARVVCAMLDPNPLVAGGGLKKLEDAGIDTRFGVLTKDAEALNPGFLKRMRKNLPFVQVKMASALDGGTAMASGESQWITGPDARADVQQFRALSCAIVTGVDTVITDNPSLNVRLADVERQPDRIILDTHARTPATAELVNKPGRTLIVHSDNADKTRLDALAAAGFELIAMPTTERIDLGMFLYWCGEENYNRLWVEAGATLAGSFIAKGFADEVILYQAAKFLGAGARPLIGQRYEQLKDVPEFAVADIRQVGNDVRWTLHPMQHQS